MARDEYLEEVVKLRRQAQEHGHIVDDLREQVDTHSRSILAPPDPDVAVRCAC